MVDEENPTIVEGALVWVPDEDAVVLPAVVLRAFDRGDEGYVSIDYTSNGNGESKRSVTLSSSHTNDIDFTLMDAKVLDPDIDDLITLDELTEAAILHKLRLRFGAHQIYTNVSSVLISINPYQQLPLYGEELLGDYLGTSDKTKILAPHIFQTARTAFANMRRDCRSQSVLVSGESGAGKTEATKHILRYLASASGGGRSSDDTPCNSSNSIEQRILQASPLLEAFGNAKTIRNNNSSRFGKLVSVNFSTGHSGGDKTNTDGSTRGGHGGGDGDSGPEKGPCTTTGASVGRVLGASIVEYLLEKSRVVQTQVHRCKHYCDCECKCGCK
jgi:myosin heavy subunit